MTTVLNNYCTVDVRDEVKDERRRNSLAFYISSYVEFEGEEYQALVTAVEKDRHAKTGGKAPVFKDTSESEIAAAATLYILYMLIVMIIHQVYHQHHHNELLLLLLYSYRV